MKKSDNNSLRVTEHERRRRTAETLASAGMILVAAGLLIPLFDLFHTQLLDICKWIFAAGALMSLASRLAVRPDRSESFRLRRLRRMEFWSAACFGVAAFFWFYNEHKFSAFPSGTVGSLAILRDTILFSMAGALLQIVAAWLIYFRQKKERRDKE